MAEARSLKQREYGTDVLSHPDQNVVDYNKATRYNNTHKSNVFHNEPDHDANKRLVKQRNNFLAEKPLTTQVARASYQDSNIFGNKNASVGTVQVSATAPPKEIGVRNTNTHVSSVFADDTQNQVRVRESRTFQSGIFGDPVTENKGRTRLGGVSSGTSTLFGDHKPDYQRSNNNGMIAAPKEVARPEKNAPNASDAKAKELYGNTAVAYGYNKGKRDGALMSSGADWKNTGQSATNKGSPMKGKNKMGEGAVDTREKKYQQLQSSVFGGGYLAGEPVEFDREARRNDLGAADDWKTGAGMAKPINSGSTRTDTFRQRQKQLASQVFDQTDHMAHMPISKKAVDIDNIGSNARPEPKGLKADGELKQRFQGFEKVRSNYDGYSAGGAKQANLASSFDVQREAPARSQPQTDSAPVSYTIQGRETKATKQAMLASNDPVTGKSSMASYDRVQPPSATRVVDLCLSGLPSNTDLIGVKKMSGARHVISAQLDEDNMKGICTGTGRIQIRLNQGENLDDIQLNFTSKGVEVNEFSQDSRKKPALTGAPTQFANEITNTKKAKQAFLQTTGGGIFGQGGDYQVSQ